MRLVIFLLLVVITACYSRQDKKPFLDRDNIAYASVAKYPDTVQYRLTEEQLDGFLARWASGVSKGPLKFPMPYYQLTVHFKSDSSFTFDVRNDVFKHRLQECVAIGDKTFVEDVWRHLAGLTDNHYEFLPTYKEGDEVYQVADRYEGEYREAIKQVLTYYKHNYIEKGGRIFYEGEIDEEVLLDYTNKSKDIEWLATHQPQDTLLVP
jgi:hypothetical protein